MRSDGSSVESHSERYLWNSRLVSQGDLIAFTKMRKGRFYIGVMRIDGSGERLLTENYYQEAIGSPNGRVLVFYRETKSGSKEKDLQPNYGLLI